MAASLATLIKALLAKLMITRMIAIPSMSGKAYGATIQNQITRLGVDSSKD